MKYTMEQHRQIRQRALDLLARGGITTESVRVNMDIVGGSTERRAEIKAAIDQALRTLDGIRWSVS